MNGSQCEKCGHALAIADQRCPGCGTPVPDAQRLGVMLPRAEAFAADERYVEAARSLEPALAMSLEPEQAKTLWRKKGVWLRKAAATQPQYLDGAEEALTKALHLDDLDDLSHQIWIDLLVQRGFADKARAWYKQRLELNPEDAVAKRQQAVLRLAADFKVQPRPQSSLDQAEEPHGFLWKMVVPSRGKTWTIGLSGIFSLVIALNGFLNGPPAAPAAQAPLAVDPELASATAASINPGELIGKAMDPWLNLYVALACAAYVYWGYSRRKPPKRG
jgi:tetratricopeptide (TPR) repeat protein